MINSGKYCTNCINLPFGNRRIDAEGDGSSGIILLGDSPWKTEIEAGHNFHGPSGQLLNRILERLGINRQSLTITNSMGCQPRHLGWTDHSDKFPEALVALRQCEPYLRDTVDRAKPKVIVAMGNVAMRQAISQDIAQDVSQRHSYVHESGYGIPAIPTFHPSYIMQGKHKLEIAVMFAIRRAQEIANGSYRESHFNLLLDPNIQDGINYLRNHLRRNSNRISLLMVDIETPESGDLDEEDLEEKGISYNIDRAGFSLDSESGISFPFVEPYIGLLQEAINASDMVSEWADNHFDSRRLAAAGVKIPGRLISGMWAWHFYQSDLLKGLGFVAPFFYAGPPFKHLASSQPALYNALDNAVGRACTIGSMEKLEAEGRLDRFLRHCVDADKIYVKMGGMGVRLDTERFGQFRDRLKSEYTQQVETMQPLVPDKVKNIKVWKRKPKVIDEDGYTLVKSGKRIDRCKVEMMEAGGCRTILPFNPGSPLQIKELIKSLGLKVPVDRDGETTGAKHLKRFSKYPIFHAIHIAKQRKTLIANYDWQVNKDGRITTTYGYHPSTLRKCVARGSMIEVVRDVSKQPYGVPIEEVKAGDLAYTYDSSGKLTLRKVLWAGQTGVKQVIRLHWMALGSGAMMGFLDVTPDHLIRLTDGTYKAAKDLRLAYGRRKRTIKGDSILSLHRGDFLDNKYSRLSGMGLPDDKASILDHRFIYQTLTGDKPDHVHHRNGNGKDNRPDNLRGMSITEHLTLTGLQRWKRNRKGLINHRIVAVETIIDPVEVYDIEVEETHNFIANELCVHNSSRNYNLQVIPKRSDLADEFRRSIVAAPGHYLLTSDGSAIEAVLVGYDAGSDSYIRLAKAGLHGWMTAAYHNEPIDLKLPFNELSKRCKMAKKKWPVDYETLKRVGHLSNYLGTPYRIYEEYPEEFDSPIAAGQLQNFYFSTGPGREVRQWQSRVMQEAHRDNYLDNHFNYRHYFYSVFKKDVKTRQWLVDHDGDAKRAVAFRPQSDASAIQTEVILRLAEGYERMMDWLRLIIHDEIVLEVPEDEIEDAATCLHTEMVRPLEELPMKDGSYLSIGAETKYGRNLAVYNAESNPDGMREMVVEEGI